jgi:hypothetical protein
VGTTVRGGVDYARFDWRQRVALVFGNEASGLGDEVLDGLDQRVSIPMVGRAESLNVGVSASVLCFEALRQRRGTDGAAAEGAAGGSGGGDRPTTDLRSVPSTISGMETPPGVRGEQTGSGAGPAGPTGAGSSTGAGSGHG